MTIDELLPRFQNGRRASGGYSVLCPAHEDRNNSLSISVGDDGRILLYCHAGCPLDAVLLKVGLEPKDLFASNGRTNGSAKRKQTATKKPKVFATPAGIRNNIIGRLTQEHGPGVRLVRTWIYDTFHVLRFDLPTPTGEKQRKEFRPVHQVPLGTDGKTGWCLGYPPGLRPLYRLKEIEAAADDAIPTIHGGEKCADAAWAIGIPATTCAGGENAINKTDWTPLRRFCKVKVCLDNDMAGEKFASVCEILKNQNSTQVVELVRFSNVPPKGDIVDWIDTHGDAADPEALRQEFEQLATAAVEPTTLTRTAAPLAPGTRVRAGDRGNIGEIVADNGDTCIVHFVSPEGQQAEKELPKSQLRSLDGHALVESDEPPIPPPCSLRELVLTYPAQREPVIDGLLRVGETMNIVAAPKKGKSWLGNSLALSIASGCSWLDTFPCARGRVLLLDAELHPEVIAHRLPDVANAMGLSPEYLDFIDVLPLRGLGIDLLKLKPLIESIKPGHYALVILDAWYRFLPLGFSENDNAQVMALYNQIDAYAGRLKAAWVNIHHASKGDQSGKGTTDVGSGAGSQSRAADTHLVIRQHEQEDVAVIEAVVRSWPPVERFAVRWSFPTWQLDGEADPRKLLGARAAKDRANRENKDVHLSEDRQAIVNVMMGMAGPETKTFIRDSTRIGNPRFGYAWASLITDGTIATAGKIKKGNNQSFDAFVLSHQEDGDDASG